MKTVGYLCKKFILDVSLVSVFTSGFMLYYFLWLILRWIKKDEKVPQAVVCVFSRYISQNKLLMLSRNMQQLIKSLTICGMQVNFHRIIILNNLHWRNQMKHFSLWNITFDCFSCFYRILNFFNSLCLS